MHERDETSTATMMKRAALIIAIVIACVEVDRILSRFGALALIVIAGLMFAVHWWTQQGHERELAAMQAQIDERQSLIDASFDNTFDQLLADN